jgi:hypothetical protein
MWIAADWRAVNGNDDIITDNAQKIFQTNGYLVAASWLVTEINYIKLFSKFPKKLWEKAIIERYLENRKSLKYSEWIPKESKDTMQSSWMFADGKDMYRIDVWWMVKKIKDFDTLWSWDSWCDGIMQRLHDRWCFNAQDPKTEETIIAAFVNLYNTVAKRTTTINWLQSLFSINRKWKIKAYYSDS